MGSSDENSNNRVFKKAIHIKAESYQIKAVSFEGQDGQPVGNGSIDFGSLRVGDSNTQTITLKNKGKYQIEYAFNVRKPHLKELFVLEPATGMIQPGEVCEIAATFCSKYEVMLKEIKDIRCTISEPHTGQPFETFNVLASARSSWSRFKLQPGRGLAFGAVRFNEVPRTRLFQIKNEGQFAFVFGCKDGGAEAAPDPGCDAAVNSATPLALLDPSILGPDGHPPVTPPELIPKTIDRFTLTPSGGLVEPGQTVGVEVAFNPKGGPASHKSVISVLVSGADPTDSATMNALKFDIVGETCHPGILTNDFRSIFEEQSVIPSLAEALANKGGGVGDDLSLRPCYCEEEVLFTYGSVVCSNHPKGAVERFKISNPQKIPCTVKFSLEPVAGAVVTKDDKGKGGANSGSGGMNDLSAFFFASDVTETVEIAPHEHYYIPVHFKPTEMRSYRCNFKAVVSDGNSNPQTSTITFDLTGKGTMPCVTVEAPLARSSKGEVLIDFGRVHVGRSMQKSITVANDGKVTSTALFEKIVPVPLKTDNNILGENLSQHSDRLFSFNASGTSITLESDQRKTFFAVFTPPTELVSERSETLAIGTEVASTVRMTVMHNPFESTIYRLVGVVYANDVLMEDLPERPVGSTPSPGGSENSLNFGEYDMEHEEGPKLVTFTLRNRSDAFLRYEWGSDAAPFSVAPRAGHLAPGQTIEAVAMFSSSEAASCTAVPLPLTTQRIKLAEVPQSNSDLWTSAIKANRPASKAEITAFDKDPANHPKVFMLDGVATIEDEAPEPSLELLGEKSEQTLECSAVADTVRYECETKVIPFSPTAMFQVRTYSFEVKNPSGMSLPYRWKLEDAVKPGSTTAAISRMTTPSGGMSTIVLPCPFTIEPGEGTIPALSSASFTVKFAPSEVEEFVYYLDAQMPTLVNSMEPLRVLVRGKSIRPVAHFDLAENPDYLNSRPFGIRNEMGAIGPIEASSCRCAELTSRGTRARNVKRFYVHNPTSSPYDFTWGATGVPDPSWRCMTPKGTILSGRKGEMIFEYTPETVGHAQEAFFKFKIPSHGIDELFLFSGTVLEPEVVFDRMKIDFNALMVGTIAVERVHIENHESLPFSFHFDKSSMGGADASGGSNKQNNKSRPILDISPMSGLVPPNGRLPIDVTFCPTEEKFSNFNLVAVVRRKPLALGLNVKGEGYAIHARISCSDVTSSQKSLTASSSDSTETDSGALSAGGGDNGSDTIELLPMPTVNVIDFGSMNLNESRTKKVVVSNMGRFNFDYLWTRNSKASSLGPMLEIRGGQLGGTVRKGSSTELTWVFRPVNNVVDLDGCEFNCTVAGKYEYIVKLKGQGLKPALHFSFHKWDFGPCFVTPPGAPPVEEIVVLNVVNHDPAATLSLDCTFENTRTLSVECPPRVMEPGHSVNIPIRFTPRDIADFSCQVPFLVNGSTKVNVTFSGYGIPARLELANPTHSICNFGVVSEGEEHSKMVKLVNRSKRPIEFELFDHQYMSRGKLESKSVTFHPSVPTVLQPRESIDVEIRYSPAKRMPLFTEDLMVKYAGNEKVLLSISGSSSGMNVSFEQDTLPFGTVCTGSLLTKPLVLENNGDLVATYRWLPATFGNHFSITPLEGRVGPGAAATFMVTFQPLSEDEDIRADGMKLLVDGGPPLTLNCLGACVPQPADSIMDLNFTGKVRRSTMQQLMLKNPTAKPWYLTPVLVGDHWRCNKEVLVPANGTAKFDVTFFPLSMTETDDGASANKELEGSLFFALPSGSALLYRLRGTSTKPDAEGVAKVTTAAKRILPVTLPLRNWLGIPQRFNVTIELDPGTNPSSTSFEGTQTVDLPAHGGFEYVLKCKAFKEGPCGAKVTFTNPKTGEYLFHEVKVNVTAPGIMETIKLESHVRQVSHHLITIENPLPPSSELTFAPGDSWWSCDNPCIRLLRVGEMAGNKEGTFQIEYRPLHVSSAAAAGSSELETSLEFTIAELGTYKYALSLSALPHAADPILRFEAALGGSQTETFTFRTFHRAAQTFSCKVSQPAYFEIINASPSVPACNDWEGQEVKVQIKFEPEKLGNIDDLLTITQSGGAGEGGDYRVRLVGVCLRPQPQGPFEVAPGGARDIPIRNVFAVDREYNFTVDNAAFVVSNVKATIKAKDGANCNVKYTPTAGNGGGETAKLLVSCPAVPDMPPLVFYLRGKTQ
jgi:hydrocephalus-inducing protein